VKIRTPTIARLKDALLQSGRRPSAVVSPAYETLARSGILSTEEVVALTRVEPLAETMFLMMSADGKVEPDELDAVRGAVRGLSDNILRSGTITVMLENFEQRLAEHGRDQRLREIADEISSEPAEAEGAFALAAAVALADDDVATQENDLINELTIWFRISPGRANEILDQLEADRRFSQAPADGRHGDT
jgi:tellurite resistance protein